MNKLLTLQKVTKPGWYISLRFDINPSNLSSNLQLHITDTPFLVEFDNEGIWRTVTGHGLTLEQPDYFDEKDRFVGPIRISNE